MPIKMKEIKKFITEYFHFSARQTSGFLVLTLLMLVSVIAFLVYDNVSVNQPQISSKEQKKLDSLLLVINSDIPKTQDSSFAKKPESKGHQKNTFFTFDPNTANVGDFIASGLNQKLAERIIKYREKGGKFHKKEDFKKIYGLKEAEYQKLAPYISIENKNEKPIEYPKPAPKLAENKPEIKQTDLNLADSAQFEKVYGIGPTLAHRIVKYRNKLGGFVAMKQLSEVWGLDSVVIKELNARFFISEKYSPKKININTAAFDELKQHPYIGYKLAKLILNYRQQHSNYLNTSDLLKIKAISEVEYNKMLPYITL